jgi:heat shock protein HtpX
MSKSMALRSVGAEIITDPRSATERWLVDTVRRQAEKAGIGLPEVAIFDSPEPNAFATGADRNNALVAVSTGLLQQMNQDEAEAVLGHEISHVANGDMVTLTLIQGVVNTFVMVFASVIASALDRGNEREGGGHGMGYYVGYMLAQAVLGVLASIVVCWFSRQREFRADAGAAALMGRKQPMVNALTRLQHMQSEGLPPSLQAMGISGGLGKMFSSHPPLEERIAALQNAA